MDENKEDLNVREVELTGGPPFGFRIGAATTTATLFSGGGEDGEITTTVVGAVKIARVNPESKASNAGLRDGDLILSVNGEQVQIPQPSNTNASSTASNSSQSSSQDQHQKIMGLLHGDRVRLSVLSKKSKSAKKLEKALAKGEFEQQQQSSSVQWADGKTSGKMLNDTQNDSSTRNVDTEKNEEIMDNPDENTENGCLVQEIEEEVQRRSQLGQEEVNKMQPGPQGLLRQVTTPPPTVSKFIPGGSSSTSSSMNYPSSLLIRQEDLQQMKSESATSASGGGMEEPIPPIWSPPGVPPSPKLGKKFRPVTFNANSSVPSSPVLSNQNGMSSTPIQSPGGGILSPPSEPSLSVSNSFDNSFSKHLSNSSHSSSAATTTSSNLPRYQSPTVVLLQKAREGQLPKGAAYLAQPIPPPKPKPSNNASDNTRISSSVNFSLSQPGSSSSNGMGGSGNSQPVTISYSHPPPPPNSRPFKSLNSSNEVINIPTTSKSTLSGEREQREWYKKMYDSLHVEKMKPTTSTGAKCTYPAGRIKTGPPAKSFWAKRVHSNGTVSEPEDFDHPEEEEYDFNKFGNKVLSPLGSAPSSGRPPGAIRFYNPGRIEDYNPAGGMGTSAARKQRYHRQMQPDMKRHWALKNLNASAGYESDSNYVMRKRTTDTSGAKTPEPSPVSPGMQRHVYSEFQRGGEVPLEGLRKFVPGPGPRDPMFDDLDGFRTASPSQNIRYQESTVNIHYPAPVRIEEKEYVPEEELRRRQQEAMKLLYEERRKQKYIKEIEDMESRRSQYTPSQKSPIPLNRYEDGDVFDGLIDNTPRPGSGGLWQRMTTPEPMTPSTMTNMKNGGPPLALGRAKFNFTAQSARELQLVKGDLVNIRRKIDANWYEGEIRQQGKNSYFYPNGGSSPFGIFPCSYVEILPDDPTSPATNAKYSSSSNKDFEGLARVLFNFRPSHSFELELSKGEVVILTRKVDNNWFEGRKQKNPILSGIFPISYVDVVKDIGVSSCGSKSPGGGKKPVGQPVCRSLNYDDDFSLKKHHYKPNEFVLHDDSDYGEVFSPTPNKMNDRNTRNRRRMNQRLELITIDTRLNNDQPFRYRAIYNYKPVHRDELELSEGDIVEVLEKCDDGWWVGTSQRSGLFGTFPGNYVERA